MKARIVVILLLGACVASAEDTPAYARLKKIASEMAKFGMPVDIGKVRMSVREPQGAQLRVESPFGRRSAGGDSATRFVEDAWGLGQEQQTFKAWAYYAPSDRRVVFHAIGTADLMGGDAVAAHELTHAYQDQRDKNWLGPYWSPTEAHNIRACLGEGEAQLAELLLHLQRNGKTLADAHLPAIDALRRGGVRLGGGSAPYIAGFRFAAEQAREHGVERLVQWQTKPPTSSEQILHPEKAGRDLPTPITFPEFPGDFIQKVDCLGELELFRIWSQKRPAIAALRASIGWDGDALRVYRTREKQVFSVWVSAWDRLADAQQAWTIVKQCWSGDVIRNGRTVIWFCAIPQELRERVRAACADHIVTKTFDKEAGKSTAEIEERWVAAFRRSRDRSGGRWRIGDVPVSLPVPSGWSVYDAEMGTGLYSDAVNDRWIGFGVSTWPLAAFGDLRGIEKFVRRPSHALYWMKLHKAERITHKGADALLVERQAMWGRRVLPGSFRELYVPVGETLVRYAVEFRAGTPRRLIRQAQQALRAFELD